MRLRRQEPSFDPTEICTVVKVVPGAGGIDAQAWAALLLRAYVLWAKRCGIGSDSEGQDGLFVFAPSGPYFSLEPGVHRFVRTSPFDSGNRRHSCFAAVYVNSLTTSEPVRSYVLDPYTLVKQLDDSGRETDDAAGVLDGDFSAFYPDALA